MAKSYIWLEEKSKRINEFSIGYMMNPNFSMNKAFKEQVKVCMKTTFSTSTMTNISKILPKPNTRVLALDMFFQNRKKYGKKMFRVLSCVIYTIIRGQVCIDYLGSGKSLIELRLGVDGRYKHLDKKYDNVLGFGIPNLLMKLLFCQVFLNNNASVVILKFPNRMFE